MICTETHNVSKVTFNDTNVNMMIVLNNRKAHNLLPVTVVAAMLMSIGTIGNLCVITVISTRMSKKAINCFVLMLASIDLFSCLVSSPLDIIELLHPYYFTVPALCKLVRFSRSLSTSSSGFLLIAIATERYRLVCKYNKSHMSGRQAVLAGSGVLVLSLFLSWPGLVLFGPKTVSLPRDSDAHGLECSISNDYQCSALPVAFYSILIILFFLTFISLCALYGLIGVKIWKLRKMNKKGEPLAPASSETALTKDRVDNQADIVQALKNLVIRQGERRGTAFFADIGQQRKAYSRRRTTFIMVAMTSLFLISCLPFIIVSICRFLIEDLDLHLSSAEEVFFHFSLKSFMFSPAINPYIYGFSNERFKQEFFSFPLIRNVNCTLIARDVSDTSVSPKQSRTNEHSNEFVENK